MLLSGWSKSKINRKEAFSHLCKVSVCLHFSMYIPGGKIHRLYMPNAIYMISDYSYSGRVAKTAKLLSKKTSVYFYIYRYSMSNSMGDLTVYNRGWKFWIKMMMQRYGIGQCRLN